MKKILLNIVIIMMTICCCLAAPTKKTYRMILITNINSCSMCNHTTASIITDNTMFNNIEFLLSAEDVTQEQAKEFLTEMMSRPCKITLDTRLYDKIASSISFFKMPHLIVLDTMNKVLFKTPIDSIPYYTDVIETYSNSIYKNSVVSNDRIKKIIGWRTLNKVDNYFIVTGWQNSDKVYIYDKTTNKLDSLYFTNNDEIIHSLIKAGDDHDIDMAKMKAVYKKYQQPYNLIQFGTGAISGEDQISSSIDLQYIDPDKRLDTIQSEWLTYVYSFKPATKKMKILPLVDWASDSLKGYIFDQYKVDYQSYRELNDSTWIIGGEEYIEEPYDMKNNPIVNDSTMLLINRQPKSNYKQDQLFFYFHKAKDDPKLRYSGKYIKIEFDSIRSFAGEKLNEPGYMWQYEFKYPYFYYNAAPLIYNDLDKSIFDVRKLNKNITWIHALDIDQNVIRILVQEKKNRVLYVVLKDSMKIIKRHNFGEIPSKNNIVLEKENIYYMNKEGQIIEMVKF